MEKHNSVYAFGKTDVGRHRDHNEDYFAYNDQLFIVADGIGGHNAGEVASKLGVEDIRSFSKLKDIDDPDFLQQAIDHANQLIYREATNNSKYRGMGCTLVTALFTGSNRIQIANVGDARVYLLRDDTLSVLSEDHSVVGELVRSNEITWEQARVHPLRNQITRALGTQPTIHPYFSTHDLQLNDLLLLCSDGLWDMLSDTAIKQILQSTTDLEKMCSSLIDAANKAGGSDNITVLVIRYT